MVLRYLFGSKGKIIVLLLLLLGVFLLPSYAGRNELVRHDVGCGGCNVIVIVIDAARWDHFGVYGYSKNTTPNIDKLAEKSFVFENAISQATWTKPSVASIFTSFYPSRHNVDLYSYNIKDGVISNILPNSFTTLAEVLKHEGYATYGLVWNGWVGPELNFNQGFDEYSVLGPDEYMTNKLVDLLNNTKYDKPFFVYLHYMGSHAPYVPPERFRQMFVERGYEFVNTSEKHQADYLLMNLSRGQLDYIKSQYDGKIASSDSQVGEVVNSLAVRGLLNRTIVIVTADHGEEFFDHEGCFGHGWSPYDTLVRVPLIVWIPGVGNGSFHVSSQVRLIDLMPTIVNLTGGIVPEGLDGLSVVPLMEGGAMNLTAYSEMSERLIDGEVFKTLAVREGRWKFMYGVNGAKEHLFDLQSDPYEKSDVAGYDDLKQKFRKEVLDYYNRNTLLWESISDKNVTSLGNETLDQLRSLGYLQ
jgi:choline-sulfatase